MGPKLSDRRRRVLWRTAMAAVPVALALIACWPVTTAVGVDYRVTVKRLTLGEKMIDFIDRDLQMRRLTREVAGEAELPEQRLLRMYDWVTANIHPVPPGLPVIDDHVFHIFVRHYGAPDQRAEALAALASYDGMPATVVGVGKNPKRLAVQLTLVRLDDRVVVLDITNRIVFRARSGRLASIDDLVADPGIIHDAGAGIMIDDVPYAEHFHRLHEVSPVFRRMESQRVWPRLRQELARLFFRR
ncbi:MAG: hypothetical protein AB1806_18375 [Acidobacteriota bacterium]